ncbi:hypothetical protein [Frateuria sp. STR12]|uniref:hypothetical protein n=1 Tax=Frateuria hangzhouensis TaxID=2995589 RepID=UPI002260AC9C|nr:hypothetical protein [Frateuria sp. STR12]MCX7512553.1 hypothetical protein [Frateuria sp. STR12]
MRDLVKAELLRFRGWALGAFAAHLLVLAFLARVVDLAQQPLLVYRVFGSIYVLAGVLLGLYQMGSYRRPNVWLNLLHRPLAPWRIATSLLGAGLAWLAVAAALPVLLAAAYQSGLTARVVDDRHWLLPLAAWLLAAGGYLAGACCMLGTRKRSAAALVLLVAVALNQASGVWALLVQALALAWLVAMLIVSFKPDLSAPPRAPLATVLLALPLQMAVYLMILLLQFGGQMLWIMQGSHPNNTETPPRGGANETERMSPKQRMLAGLAVSRAAQAPLWREQVALSDVAGIGLDLHAVPVRGALTNAAPTDFDDAGRGVRWTFSHDRMRLAGYRIVGGRAAGTLGVGAANAAFPAPTVAIGGLPGQPKGDRSLIAGNMLYHYVSDSARVLPRIRLPAGEWLLGVTPVGENLAVLSDRALYFFDGRDVVLGEALLAPRQRMPIPGAAGDLRDLDLIELVDGYLVSASFTSYAYMMDGAAPYQALSWVHDDGQVTTVARRALVFDYPAWFRYQAWWPSPALYALRQGALGLFAVPDPLQATHPAPMPRGIKLLAAGLMLVSLLAALWLVRRRALSMPARMGWVLACGAIGLPALASLWLLYPACELAGRRAEGQSALASAAPL